MVEEASVWIVLDADTEPAFGAELEFYHSILYYVDGYVAYYYCDIYKQCVLIFRKEAVG